MGFGHELDYTENDVEDIEQEGKKGGYKPFGNGSLGKFGFKGNIQEASRFKTFYMADIAGKVCHLLKVCSSIQVYIGGVQQRIKD